jgi:hypothetical protein
MIAPGKAGVNDRGSALIITLMLLVILTAIGMYAISISTTERTIAIQSRVGTATFNAADAGANWGIDQMIPIGSSNRDSRVLPDQYVYNVVSEETGNREQRFGFSTETWFVDYEVTSTATPPTSPGERGVQAVVVYGPVIYE